MTETTQQKTASLWDAHRVGGKLLLQRQRTVENLPLPGFSPPRCTSRTTSEAIKNCLNPAAVLPRNPAENKRRVWIKKSA